MTNATNALRPGQDDGVERVEVAGYRAVRGYDSFPNKVHPRTAEDYDRANLEKLWHTGFDVASLDEAHEKWKLSPLRTTVDIYKILGHATNPKNAKGGERFQDAALTTLAIQYPSLLDPGEVLPFTTIIRLRYPQPVYTIRGPKAKGGPGVESRRYDQPIKQSEENSPSEPYFLYGTHSRLYDKTLPLWITEGEMKGAALGLAGKAAIAFGGVHMWTAPKKAGKNKIHPSLDPAGPCQHWAIPIHRPVYLIPDLDYRSNMNVKKAFSGLGYALIQAGAPNAVLVNIPNPPRPGLWKGIDDYLTYKLGQRWSGDPAKVTQAEEILDDLVKNHSQPFRQTDRYSALTVKRGAERVYDRLQLPDRFTAVLTGQTDTGMTRIGWLTYQEDQYVMQSVDQTIGNTSGKVGVKDIGLQRLAVEAYELGVDQAIADGEVTGQPDEMPTDYPNRVYAAVNRELPEHQDNTLLEQFPGVSYGDHCIRINRALLNWTTYLREGGEWHRRDQWLLPPDHRWFATGSMNVSLGNLSKRPECPTFLAMLHHAFDNDQESVDMLQMYFGKFITCPEFVATQQFLAIYGEAGSGKGTFYRILTHVIGLPNIGNMRAEYGGRFDTATLPGKKLVAFQEAPEVGVGEFHPHMAVVIKQITGEDDLVYEKKGQEIRQTKLRAEMIIVGNDPPVIPMAPKAFERRAVFIHFAKLIENRDWRVEKYMMDYEIPGIFLWALEGAMRLKAGAKLTTPKRCLLDLEDVTADVSPEERYVLTQLKISTANDSKGFLRAADIFDHYQMWVRQHGGRFNPCSPKKLGILIRQRWNVASKPTRVGNKMERAYSGLAFVNPVY